jgi:hypothetical protein
MNAERAAILMVGILKLINETIEEEGITTQEVFVAMEGVYCKLLTALSHEVAIEVAHGIGKSLLRSLNAPREQ